MRSGTTPELQTALDAPGITTALLFSLPFASETVNVWTGTHSIVVNGSGDSSMDGLTFDPFQNGIVVGIGDNNFTTNGSDALEISLAIPDSPSTAISAATAIPAEYKGRTAIIWRGIMLAPPGPDTPPTWAFRRVRVGSMDELRITNDGTSHQFTLTIEGHASMISAATGSTYMDQPRFDPADTSQQFVKACANGDPAPAKVNSNGLGLIGGGLGGVIKRNQV